MCRKEENFDWSEICPICKAKEGGLVFCRECKFKLKPMGGRDNDPESICTTEKKLNFVMGCMVVVLCKDKNGKGNCKDYEYKGEI